MIINQSQATVSVHVPRYVEYVKLHVVNLFI